MCVSWSKVGPLCSGLHRVNESWAAKPGGRETMATQTKKEKPERRKPKGIEEVVQYALGHKLRVEILIILNQGIFTSTQIAELLDAKPPDAAGDRPVTIKGALGHLHGSASGDIDLRRDHQSGQL